MKIKMVKKIFFTALLFLFLSPFLVLAGGYDGLIPCGFRNWHPCQLCHLFILFDNIVRFILFSVVPAVAALMVVIGGLIFFLAQGNPGKIQKAKSLFVWLFIGLILLYGSWLIVGLFFSIIGVAGWTGLDGGWFTFNFENCPVGPR